MTASAAFGVEVGLVQVRAQQGEERERGTRHLSAFPFCLSE
jgi:hypothetical protein